MLQSVAESFNPTMVRLLPTYPRQITMSVRGFNPTMVRLLHAGGTNHESVNRKFQSHNGAIAA